MTELAQPPGVRSAPMRRNRARILETAARELFASELPDVQIDDLARCAGVGVGTLYRHFPDKEALMGELVRERFEAVQREFSPAGSPLEDARGGPVRRRSCRRAARRTRPAVAADAATRFALMRGGERVFAHAGAERGEFNCGSPRRLVLRARRAAGELRADFQRHTTSRW